MEKQKQIQISEEAFLDALMVCCNILNDEIRACLNQEELKVVERLEKALESKLNKIVLHNIYSKSKDAALTDEEREIARQDYLNRKGIQKNFRW